MTTQTFENVSPIFRGYDATLTISYEQDLWDSYGLGTSRIRASFKNKLDDENPVFTADSDDTTVQTDDGLRTVTITVPGTATADFSRNDIHFDLASIEGGGQRIVPGRWAWSVSDPVTDPVVLP